MLPPPAPLSLPVIRCPSCDHGIDPHKAGGFYCLVRDEDAEGCPCLWSPNDIAAFWLAKPKNEMEQLLDRLEEFGMDEKW